MLLALFLKLLPLLGVATTTVAEPVVVTNAKVAQVRLAEYLAGADDIHQISARGREITFAITRGDRELAVIATTNAHDEVVALSVATVAIVSGGRAAGGDGLGWLADELESVTAVVSLEVDEDDAVTLGASDGRRYMMIPGRGSGGPNAAAAARWAATWSE